MLDLDIMRRRQKLTAITVVTWAYPFGLVASLYLTWFTAWAVIGHRPVAYVDDPSGLSAWVDAAYVVSGLMLIAFPVAIAAGIMATVWYGAVRRRSRLAITAAVLLLILLWIAALGVIRWDPLSVGDWYMD
jgi:hypothetical protein